MATYLLDMDMGLDELSDIFRRNNWEYAAYGAYGVPEVDDLGAQMMVLAGEIDYRDLDYIHQGRLAIVRDPEVDGVFQILLTVGYLYNEDVEPFGDA
jgi:hypothetical protein